MAKEIGTGNSNSGFVRQKVSFVEVQSLEEGRIVCRYVIRVLIVYVDIIEAGRNKSHHQGEQSGGAGPRAKISQWDNVRLDC